jgi:hypothetical protein
MKKSTWFVCLYVLYAFVNLSAQCPAVDKVLVDRSKIQREPGLNQDLGKTPISGGSVSWPSPTVNNLFTARYMDSNGEMSDPPRKTVQGAILRLDDLKNKGVINVELQTVCSDGSTSDFVLITDVMSISDPCKIAQRPASPSILSDTLSQSGDTLSGLIKWSSVNDADYYWIKINSVCHSREFPVPDTFYHITCIVGDSVLLYAVNDIDKCGSYFSDPVQVPVNLPQGNRMQPSKQPKHKRRINPNRPKHR